MIGTGSTGIQAAPVIAAAAAHLTVFQRTANYSVPARNGPLTPEFRQYVKQHPDEIRAVTRETLNGMAFRIEQRLAVETPPEEREQIYEAAWARGGLQFRAAFQDMLVDKAANDTAADFIRRKIRSIVKDPKTAAILSDIDHPYAAKRPPIDTDYFETFNRPNVTLVDVKAAPIQAITPAGIRTAEAEYPLDIIVFATGFDAMTGPMLRIDIRGRGGVALKDVWEAGPRNYLGLQVAGFPNLFTITGPGSPSVLCNMPVAIEQHADWIADCIEPHAFAGSRTDRGPPRGGGQMGGRGQRRCQQDAVSAGQAFLVSGGQHSRQAQGIHALCRGHGAVSGDLPAGRGAGLRGVRPLVARLRARSPLPAARPVALTISRSRAAAPRATPAP